MGDTSEMPATQVLDSPPAAVPVPPYGSDLEPETYNAFLKTLSLAQIAVISLAADRIADGLASHTRFDLAATFQVEGTTMHFRFDAKAHLLARLPSPDASITSAPDGEDAQPAEADGGETELGTVSASVLVTVSSAAPLRTGCAERFGQTSATMMAHPYLREALATTALRIGFLGVLLPAIVQQP